MNKYLIITLIIWNIIVFLIYGLDKKKAKKGARRISEKTLLLAAFFMGSIGAITGMNYFRHKTKHLKFKILFPLSIIVNGGIIYGYCTLT